MVTEEKINVYISKVYAEMELRGISKQEIPYVIGKTGFEEAIHLYPEEQMHYSIEDAVNEILLVAAKH